LKVVIDTNVVVSRFLSPKGPPAQVFHLWEDQAFGLVVSQSLLEEYRRALLYEDVASRHGMSEAEVLEVVAMMERFALVVEPKMTVSVITRDSSDNKFIECAMEGGAEFIVSGDSHLLDLGRYEGVEIITPAAFLALFRP